jgi:hypothetical protein
MHYLANTTRGPYLSQAVMRTGLSRLQGLNRTVSKQAGRHDGMLGVLVAYERRGIVSIRRRKGCQNVIAPGV